MDLIGVKLLPNPYEEMNQLETEGRIIEIFDEDT